MTLQWKCVCGKSLNAPETAAGKKGRCPQCKAIVTVPGTAQPAVRADAAASSDAGAAQQKQPKPVSSPQIPRQPASPPTRTPLASPAARGPAAAVTPPLRRPIRGDRSSQTGSLREYAYLVLLLALIPLAIFTLESHRSFLDQLTDSVAEQPNIQPRLADWVSRLNKGATLDELFDILPEHRLPDALLAHGSQMHWLFAIVAAALFAALLIAVFPNSRTSAGALLGGGLFTATVGILLLIGIQYAASATDGYYVIGFGIRAIVFYIIKFIGFSYSAANDPNNGFLASFFGYTMGVGMCEEFCKAIPLLFRLKSLESPSRNPANNWRAACRWGMISGAGFGIAEGIVYSVNDYNGFAPGLLYVVRFASCVALHTIWSGSAGITLFNRQGAIDGSDKWYEYLLQVVFTISIAMTLHGLYDTCFKKGYDLAAMGVAAASFAWLTIQIESMRRSDPIPRTVRAAA